jgi:hypothetical protein
MSIKIYNGYILKNNDIVEFRNNVIKHIPAIRKLKKDFINKIIDDERYGNNNIERYKNIERLFKRELPFEVTIYPIKNKMLAQLFVGNLIYKHEIINQILNDIGLKFYGYWNNVDPDDCSEEEWNQREEDWSEALLLDDDESSSRACNLGFTISLANDNMIDF